jgi:hypothetical protein
MLWGWTSLYEGQTRSDAGLSLPRLAATIWVQDAANLVTFPGL